MNPNDKFLFDTSFDPDVLSGDAKARAAEEAASEEPPAPTFSEEELSAARQAAYGEGAAAGRAEAEEGIARQTAKQLTSLAAHLEALSGTLDTIMSEKHQETLLAAMTVVRKLFPRLNDESGLTEIKAVVEACLERLRDEPRMVIRAAEPQIDVLKAELDTCIKRSGFTGKLVFLADDRLQPGDVRAEWADGGAERDQDALWQEIDQVIERTLMAALASSRKSDDQPSVGDNKDDTSQPKPSAEIEPLQQAKTA